MIGWLPPKHYPLRQDDFEGHAMVAFVAVDIALWLAFAVIVAIVV